MARIRGQTASLDNCRGTIDRSPFSAPQATPTTIVPESSSNCFYPHISCALLAVPPTNPNMAPAATTQWNPEKEDKSRDAAFSKVLHGQVNQRGGLMSMFGKDSASKKEAVDEYFKHWDNKKADVETEEDRKARRDEYATLTRQYASTLPILPQLLTILSQLLQPRDRPLRIWLGHILPFLSLRLSRTFLPSHRAARTLPCSTNEPERKLSCP